jgi:hypothetical protein
VQVQKVGWIVRLLTTKNTILHMKRQKPGVMAKTMIAMVISTLGANAITETSKVADRQVVSARLGRKLVPMANGASAAVSSLLLSYVITKTTIVMVPLTKTFPTRDRPVLSGRERVSNRVHISVKTMGLA